MKQQKAINQGLGVVMETHQDHIFWLIWKQLVGNIRYIMHLKRFIVAQNGGRCNGYGG